MEREGVSCPGRDYLGAGGFATYREGDIAEVMRCRETPPRGGTRGRCRRCRPGQAEGRGVRGGGRSRGGRSGAGGGDVLAVEAVGATERENIGGSSSLLQAKPAARRQHPFRARRASAPDFTARLVSHCPLLHLLESHGASHLEGLEPGDLYRPRTLTLRPHSEPVSVGHWLEAFLQKTGWQTPLASCLFQLGRRDLPLLWQIQSSARKRTSGADTEVCVSENFQAATSSFDFVGIFTVVKYT